MTDGGTRADLAGLGALTPAQGARHMLAGAFGGAGLPSAALDARVLVCAALGIDHAGLVREPERVLGDRAETLRGFAVRRLAREPVSRIVGEREFWGLGLEIDPSVLDPRPDTETLVETVVARLPVDRTGAWRILDLGVGSGAILCALLASLPNAFGVGVDLSAGACAMARRNLLRSGLSARGTIICGRWTEALRGPYHVIVSNPPYIRSGDISALDTEVRAHDPILALDGGADGLEAYRAIARGLAARLAESGLVALEIGIGQAEDVAAILRTARLEPVEVVRDIAGRDRVVVAVAGEPEPSASPKGR